MEIDIKDDFFQEVKNHLRIYHDVDDSILQIEIEVAALNVIDMLVQIPKDDVNYPKSSDDFTERENLAIKHLAATYRQNPDERIESKFIPQTKMLIERILGPELGYPSV